MRGINKIAIHCADWPNGKPLTIKEIDQWHGERDFNRAPEWMQKFNPHLRHVGYHYYIDVLGTVHTGRHLEEVGSHVKGWNTPSIGVCLSGRNRYTYAQWNALKKLVLELQEKYPFAIVQGHRDFPGVTKDCPGFHVATWLKNNMTPDPLHILGV